MSDSILMAFLRADLITVQGDDAKLEKLQRAADAVAKLLAKAPAKTLPFALAAFDADVSETDPVVEEVTAILTAEWPTHFNTTMGSPVAIVRGLLLSGLDAAAEKNIAIAAAFVAAARNVLPYIAAGAEAEIWSGLVSRLEDRVETEAERAWALPDSITVEPAQLKLGSVEVPAVFGRLDRKSLTTAFEGAAGPHNEDSEAPDNPNPYWPTSNQQWVTGFGARAAKAVADAVDPALKGAIGPIDLNASLGPLAAGLNHQIQEALNAISNATEGLQRRSNLLWWKEALYSPSLRQGYRDLTPEAAAAMMAFDLHQACPALTPLSVVAFLRETVGRLPTVADAGKHSFLDITAGLAKATSAEPLRDSVRAFGLAGRRGPVVSIIAGVGHWPLTAAEFRDRTGVPADIELSPAELAVWLFLELQACRITQAEPARRGRKATT